MIELALFQPDIPQNAGTMLRMCACLGVRAHIIEPAGFPITDKHFRRSGMDYLEYVEILRHISFDDFFHAIQTQNKRLILLSTKASEPFTTFSFSPNDVLMVGRESAGVPQDVFEKSHKALHIPMQPHSRSLNVALSAAMVLSSALHQTNAFPQNPIQP